MADFVISSRLQIEKATIKKSAISDIQKGVSGAEIKLSKFSVSPSSGVMREVRKQLSEALAQSPIILRNFKLAINKDSVRELQDKLADKKITLKNFKVSDGSIRSIISQIQGGLRAHKFEVNVISKVPGGGGGGGAGGINISGLSSEQVLKKIHAANTIARIRFEAAEKREAIKSIGRIAKETGKFIEFQHDEAIKAVGKSARGIGRSLEFQHDSAIKSVGKSARTVGKSLEFQHDEGVKAVGGIGRSAGVGLKSNHDEALKSLKGVFLGKDIIRDWEAQSAALDKVSDAFRRLQVPAKATNQILIDNTDSIKNFGRQIGITIRRFSAYLVASTAFYKITDAVSQASSEFLEFDRNSIRLAQTLRVSRKDVDPLISKVRDLSGSLGVSSQELLKVGVTLAQAGIPLNEAKDLLETIAKTKLSPSFGSIEDTVTGVIAIKNQFNTASKDFDKILSQVNTVAAATAASSDDFIEGVKRAGGAFAQSKGTFQEFLAIFGTLKSTTQLNAATIGTALSSFTAKLQLPKTIEGFGKLGIKLEEDTAAGKKFVGVFEAFRRISEGFKDNQGSLIRELSNITEIRQVSKILPIFQQLEDGTSGFAQALRILKLAETASNSVTLDSIQAQDALDIQLRKVYESATKAVSAFGNNESIRSFSATVLSLTQNIIGLTDSLAKIAPLAAVAGLAHLAKPAARVLTGVGEGVTGKFLGFSSVFRNPNNIAQHPNQSLNISKQLSLSALAFNAGSATGVGGSTSTVKKLRETTLGGGALPEQIQLLQADTKLAINRVAQANLSAQAKRLDEELIIIKRKGGANEQIISQIQRERIQAEQRLKSLADTEAQIVTKRQGLISTVSAPFARTRNLAKSAISGKALGGIFSAASLGSLAFNTQPDVSNESGAFGTSVLNSGLRGLQHASFGALAGSAAGAPGAVVGGLVGFGHGISSFIKDYERAQLDEKFGDLAIKLGEVAEATTSAVNSEESLAIVRKSYGEKGISEINKAISEKLSQEIDSNKRRTPFLGLPIPKASGGTLGLLQSLQGFGTDTLPATRKTFGDRSNLSSLRNLGKVLLDSGLDQKSPEGRKFINTIEGGLVAFRNTPITGIQDKIKNKVVGGFNLTPNEKINKTELESILEGFKNASLSAKKAGDAITVFSNNLIAGALALEKFSKVADSISELRLGIENKFGANPQPLSAFIRSQGITSDRSQQRKAISGLGLGDIGTQFNLLQDAKEKFFTDLTQSFSKFDFESQSSNDVIDKLSESVNKAFSDPAISKELTSSILDEINGNNGLAKTFQEDLQKNRLGDFVSNFFKPLEEPLAKSADEAAKTIDSFLNIVGQVFNERAAQVKELQRLQEQVFGIESDRLHFNRSNDRFNQTNVGQQLGEVFGRRAALFGPNANDPALLHQDLKHTLISRNQADIDRRSIDANTRINGQQAFETTSNKINLLTDALSKLSDVSAALAPITQRLSELEDKRKSKLALAERVFTGDHKANADLIKGVALTSLVSNKGGLQKLNFRGLNTVQNRQLILETLKLFGPNNLPNRNITGDQLHEAVLGKVVPLGGIDAERKLLLDTANNIFTVAQEATNALKEVPNNILLELQKIDTFNVQSAVFNIAKGHVENAEGVGLAGGGTVRGSSGIDTIPAMLTKDEYVINAKSSKKHRRLIEAINKDQVKHLAGGGAVQDLSDQYAAIERQSLITAAENVKRTAHRKRAIAQSQPFGGIDTTVDTTRFKRKPVSYKSNFDLKKQLKEVFTLKSNTELDESLAEGDRQFRYQHTLSPKDVKKLLPSHRMIEATNSIFNGLGVPTSMIGFGNNRNLNLGDPEKRARLKQEHIANMTDLKLNRINRVRNRKGLEPFEDLDEFNTSRSRKRPVPQANNNAPQPNMQKPNAQNAQGLQGAGGANPNFDMNKFADVVNKLDTISKVLAAFPNKIDVEVKPVQVQITGLEFMNVMKDEVVQKLAEKVYETMTPESLKHKLQQAGP